MSLTDHYTTPPEVIAPIREYLGGIALDPCSNMASIVNAHTEWDIETGDDGLKHDWGKHCCSYTNPPYSPGNLPRWVKKVYEQHRKHEMRNVLLIPVSTATQWWHEYIIKATWHLYYKGRISFGDTLVELPDGAGLSNRHDSVLVGFETNPDFQKLHSVFDRQGWIVELV